MRMMLRSASSPPFKIGVKMQPAALCRTFQPSGMAKANCRATVATSEALRHEAALCRASAFLISANQLAPIRALRKELILFTFCGQ